MPESKKRVIDKEPVEQKHVNPTGNKAGRILVLILCASMVVGLLFAAIYLMISNL